MAIPERSALGCWSFEELRRFLEIRQEFFLDPMGSNKERFLEATTVLQRALFDWYLKPLGKFPGLLALVTETAEQWSNLRKEERRTLEFRRFGLNSAMPDLPAVESSVSVNQWQKIFGSLGLGLGDPGTFDRFLVQLDEETNPSLRINHRYLGELLPHDNMISYLSSITATFLNENAIIGKVSPCVTHMEQAAVKWLLNLVGWDGDFRAEPDAAHVPVQRLPTLSPPGQYFARWEREEPTGTIVAGGTIANISAMVIARNAVFDYLLAWPGAVQMLGPMLAWDLVRKIWGKERLIVLTSKGAHYSVRKAALQAGVAPSNVVEIPGSENPWILDGEALERALGQLQESDLVVAVVPIAGKTETGDVDRILEIAKVLNDPEKVGNVGLPTLPEVLAKLREMKAEDLIKDAIGTLAGKGKQLEVFRACCVHWNKEHKETKKILDRIEANNEVEHARHNRLFLHVDAAHGAGFLAVPELRDKIFAGIELADTITIDGHKSLYCYYPCGGLLIRSMRWSQTFSAEKSAYISEEENRGAYREGLVFGRYLKDDMTFSAGTEFDLVSIYDEPPETTIKETQRSALGAVYRLTERPIAGDRSELTHQPFNQYLEGSRGPQGIMQLYFNLATLGLRGYRAILGWVTLLRARCEEAISLGMSDLRLVTDPPLPDDLKASDKRAAIDSANHAEPGLFEELRPKASRKSMPVVGGRFLRLSGGECNQLLIMYVPAREAKLIATASRDYWEKKSAKEVQRVLRYIWRVNEHLWDEHIYANPHFTYYLGHTTLELVLPSMGEGNEQAAAGRLAELLTKWNAWTWQGSKRNPFFEMLCKYLADSIALDKTEGPKDEMAYIQPYARKFFCHKIVVMHPYTDESLLGDMLRRAAFWGERSVIAVRQADSTAKFLFPDKKGPAA